MLLEHSWRHSERLQTLRSRWLLSVACELGRYPQRRELQPELLIGRTMARLPAGGEDHMSCRPTRQNRSTALSDTPRYLAAPGSPAAFPGELANTELPGI